MFTILFLAAFIAKIFGVAFVFSNQFQCGILRYNFKQLLVDIFTFICKKLIATNIHQITYKLTQLIRYWFEFKRTDNTISHGIQIGCGVTAYNYSDALQLLNTKLFKDITVPEIINFIENVDIRNLDQGHVIPNMWTPSERGIWYPLFYHDNT